MSIQIILIIVAALVAIGLLSSLQDKRAIARLRSGQKKWREVAFHHSQQTVLAREEVRLLSNLIDRQRTSMEVYEHGFKIIVKHLWGAEINRTLQDVLDRYDNLIHLLSKKEEVCAGLSMVVSQQDKEIKGLKEALEIIRMQRDQARMSRGAANQVEIQKIA